jgi:UDP-glucose 4-epimerase
LKILLTGYTGFLGSHLLKSLSSHDQVIGISGTRNKNESKLLHATYQAGEISGISDKPEIVILCHARIASGSMAANDDSLYESNVRLTRQVLTRFPDSYFLFVSSVSVYGNSPGIITENSLPDPVSEYAVSKLWGEVLTRQSARFGILRLTSVYGKGMKESTIIPNYVNQALQHRRIEVWGDGGRTQNYIYVDDAVSYIGAMAKKQAQGIFLGAAKQEISNVALAEQVAGITGAKIQFSGNDTAKSFNFDNTLTREILQIKNEMKLEDGIKTYINWKEKQSW